MKPAVYDVCKINLTNEATSHIGLFLGITKSLSFEGFLRYTGQSKGDKKDKKDKKGNKSFDDIEWCHLREAEIKETESNPPHYYNESTIVKKLESSGVGRPSTYASIVNTLYNRNYTLTRDIEGVNKEEPYHKLHTTDTITKGIHKLTTPKQKKRIVLTDLGETVLEYLLKHFDTMICVEFTAHVESDLDLISTGQSDFHTVIKKVYDVFYPVIAEQLQVKRVSSDALYIGSTEVRNGKFGYYINVSGKNYGLTNYMKMSKKKIEQLTEEDVLYLTEYPKCIGLHKGHDVMLHIGPYGIYMKYNKKNYRVNRVKEHTLASLSPLLP
jgi:DNA topoisomerase-1